MPAHRLPVHPVRTTTGRSASTDSARARGWQVNGRRRPRWRPTYAAITAHVATSTPTARHRRTNPPGTSHDLTAQVSRGTRRCPDQRVAEQLAVRTTWRTARLDSVWPA